MNKELLKQLKKRLEKEKAQIEKELRRFAKKDEKLGEDWDTKFPKWNGETGLEVAADEVEEYLTRLPLEYTLELKLKDVKLTLEKIKKGSYGICERCKKQIPTERLNANPSARHCLECSMK